MKLGQETEFFIGQIPKTDTSPVPLSIYRHFEKYMHSFCRVLPSANAFGKDQFFIENGGAFCYEGHPQQFIGGLLEAATPECANAFEVCLYQRAMERWATGAESSASVHARRQPVSPARSRPSERR